MASGVKDNVEETFLLGLFNNFASFNFDKAKELIDKERDANKNMPASLWTMLLLCLSQLASIEKLYMNLTFLTPKGFLRKESSVRLSYEAILNELAGMQKKSTQVIGASLKETNMGGSVIGQPGSSPRLKMSKGVILHIRTQIMNFIQARLLMLSFYERLISSSAGDKIVMWGEMLSSINEIISKHSNSFHHPVLSPIKTSFMYECDIMSHLLGALTLMQKWHFLGSLLHLHDAHTKLTIWQNTTQNRESKKYSFSSSFLKTSPLPALFLWLGTAKTAFISKFSLYFYETLVTQAPIQDMKNLLAKQSTDYVAKIQNFMRKADVHYFCLVLAAEGLEGWKGAGYHHPSEVVPTPIGIDSYIAIASFPSKPDDHWPNIIKRIPSDGIFSKVNSLYDHKISATYFICGIEPRIFLVAIIESKKSEKESVAIRDFMYGLAIQLRCTKGHLNLGQEGERLEEMLSDHPNYLEAFCNFHHALLTGDGPLPEHIRHYIAIMAASRHQCSYLVEEEKAAFLASGGPEMWLDGLQFAPPKLQALHVTNKVLAHRPWLYDKPHIEHLLKNSWSLSELTQAICVLSHFHVMCTLVFGTGMETASGQPVAKIAKDPKDSSSGSPESKELSEGGIAVLMKRMKKISTNDDDVDLPEQQQLQSFELLKNQTAHLTGPELDIDSTALHKYAHLSPDPEFTYVDFARGKSKKQFPTLKSQDCSWDEHGFSVLDELYSEVGDLLDEKFKTAYRMTYYTIGNNTNVDTFPFRRGVWNYLHCLYGIRHDHYDYRQVNRLLETSLKTFLKMVCCYPERLLPSEHSGALMKGFLSSEKLHVIVLVVEARLQAELLYALRSISRYLL